MFRRSSACADHPRRLPIIFLFARSIHASSHARQHQHKKAYHPCHARPFRVNTKRWRIRHVCHALRVAKASCPRRRKRLACRLENSMFTVEFSTRGMSKIRQRRQASSILPRAVFARRAQRRALRQEHMRYVICLPCALVASILRDGESHAAVLYADIMFI